MNSASMLSAVATDLESESTENFCTEQQDTFISWLLRWYPDIAYQPITNDVRRRITARYVDNGARRPGRIMRKRLHSVYAYQTLVRLAGEQNWRCCYCTGEMHFDPTREHPQCVTIEHIVPVCHGGSDEVDNLVVACKRCNNTRGVMPITNFMQYLAKKQQPQVLYG